MKPQDLNRITDFYKRCGKKKQHLSLFDIDSTLYNVSPRTQKIVHDFCENKENLKIDPKAISILRDIEILPQDWGFSEALEREDFYSSIRLIKALSIFWRKRFFSDDFIKYDNLYPGAKDFLSFVLKQNSKIKYLTGRSQFKMRKGTIAKFTEDNIPLANPEDLIMKETQEIDSLYKLSIIKKLKSNYKQIAFYENAPEIINTIMDANLDVFCVFINSTHSRQEVLKYDIPIIEMDFSPLMPT